MKISYKTTGLGLAVMLLTTGCGTQVNLTKYTPATLESSSNMPSKELLMSNELPKVIIMDIDDNGIDLAKSAKVGSTIATTVNSLLSSGKSVNIVKRIEKSNYNQMLAKEIQAAQLSKEVGADVGQADKIITGQLSTTSYDHSFAEGYYYNVKTKGGTEQRYAPPSMTYKSCIAGNLKIFSLPSLAEEDTFTYNECSTKSTEVRSSSEVVEKDDGFVRKSAEKAADTVSYPLKNFFAKRGYIHEKKLDGKDAIVKTTLGTQNGAKEGEDVEIFTIEDTINSLTGITSKETIKIGSGKISDQNTPTTSWIIVDKLEDGRTIKAGDFVKIKYEEGFFSKAGKFVF